MSRPLITITSDFGVQTQGVGSMEATALGICPEANVVHLMHGLPDYDIIAGSRTMETTTFLPIGIHVCVVDPGVGTKRKPIMIKTNRGDYLIGPDNGVLISATNILGGCDKVVEITNPKYMRQPVSPVFHGRDVFTPAAAHLANGIPMKEFGKELKFDNLVTAPYEEAVMENNLIQAKVIQINKYGSLHLNILSKAWETFGVEKYDKILFKIRNEVIEIPFVETFGEVEKGKPLLLKDDYGRVEIAINSR